MKNKTNSTCRSCLFLAISYLGIGLISLFLGIFCLYNQETFIDIMFLWGPSGMLFPVDIPTLVTILFLWFILSIIAFFGIYYRKKYGRIIGVVDCSVALITSSFFYWGGIGLIFLSIFTILLIITGIHWRKL